MDDAKRTLPIHPIQGEDETPVCSPAAYVTLEEKAILAAMRSLREEGVKLRQQLRGCDDAGEREGLEAELAASRRRWQELAERREQAYRRKMIMLGHVDPGEA